MENGGLWRISPEIPCSKATGGLEIPHISWYIAKDIIQGNFVPDHLVLRLGRAQLREILM